MGDSITKVQSISMFKMILGRFQAQILNVLPVYSKLNQYQQTAVLSLVYNIGINAFRRSTLNRLLQQGQRGSKIWEQFMRWNKGTIKGKLTPIEGLTTRRKDEVKMWRGRYSA